MSLFEKYPYTNFHELNLDWIIKRMIQLDNRVKDFTAFNALTWSGLWDPSKAYTRWSIVQDNDGNGYVAVEPVPYNVPLSNTAYWQPVASYDALYAAFETRISELETKAAFAGKAFDCVPDMLACPDLGAGDIVYVLGNHVANDGGAGFWKISATDDADHYSVAYDDMFAIMVDENVFNLARYPGDYVNEMMDAARPYFFAHRWKRIYLPEPNANHPACGSWLEGGDHYNYFWKVNAPIILNEDCAYSVIEFNGGVIADVDGLEAVLKVTDNVSKPEDIYFVGHTSFGGAELPGVTHIPEHAILVEGSARLSFEFLQAGSVQNVITLGGDDQKWTVEVEIDRAEVGSWYKNCINGKLLSGTGIFKCNDLVVQRCLADNAHIIHGEGAVFDWYIGNMQCSWQATEKAGVIPFYIDTGTLSSGPSTNEMVLWVNTCRIFGDDLGYFGQNGCVRIGSIIGALSSGAGLRKLTLDGSIHLMFDNIALRNTDFEIIGNDYATCNIRQALPHPTITGRNIMINGVISGTGTMVTTQNLANAFVLDPVTEKLQLVYDGTYYDVN